MCNTLLAMGDDEEEAVLLKQKTIPFFKQQLREAEERLAQLKKQKTTQPAQETDPPKNGAYSSPAA